MKSNILLTIVALISGIATHNPNPTQNFVAVLQDAFENQKSDIQIKGEGVVIRLLSDDIEAPRHQRFIIRISPLQTLLVAHNIDISERIPNLQIDDSIEFYGEYDWNAKGGVIHWTHHDPNSYHIDGWLKYAGKTYD